MVLTRGWAAPLLLAAAPLLLAAAALHQATPQLQPTCESLIYCQGELLEDIQLSRIYSDSKTFVDKRLLFKPDEVLKNYKELKSQYGGNVPPIDVLKSFVQSNFEDGKELDEWLPPDWSEAPGILSQIWDPELRSWAKALNGIWKTLSRQVDEKVKETPEMFSLLYVPNGFVIPGGRFKELYYWDTYWIVNGLLVCDMVKTAKGVIENLLYLLKTIGHVPNGSRVYYLQRTQPPMITQMVNSYYLETQDFEFVRKNIQLLDQEIDFWLNTRAVELNKNGRRYKLFRYFAPSSGPRPESYREDYETAKIASSEEERQKLYISLKSAAESGWDFSTRWFINHGTNRGNISSIRAELIIPVDLNALLYKNFKILLDWYKELKNEEKVKKYEQLSQELLFGINEVLWNEEEGIWLDYDLLNDVPRKYFYMSNLAPLWTSAYTTTPEETTRLVIKYINRVNLTQYIGGSPTSLMNTGEQWDYPNAWPPLQAFFIQGLERIGTPDAQEIAYHFAKIYIQSNYEGFHDLGVMFEKYDSLVSGRTGDGGEYEAQSGFGWTNGFAFEILHRWGSKLTAVSNELEGTDILARLTSKCG